MSNYNYPYKNQKKKIITLYFGGLIFVSLLTISIVNINFNNLIIRGIPLPIIMEFVTDFKSLGAYIIGDEVALHDRLKEKGIEEKIKNYYRPNFETEEELDRYIHQIFYEETGYVGKRYQVNSQGTLEIKKKQKSPNKNFEKNNFKGLFNHL